jgi:uncharacterized protein DUF2786
LRAFGTILRCACLRGFGTILRCACLRGFGTILRCACLRAFGTTSREGGQMNTETPDALLGRVRKLLVKAEADGVTQAEAQALTAKAAELMAKYGIDRALLAARRPETDRPADRVIDIGNPWARVQAHLLCGLAAALRCQCVILPRSGPGSRIHLFGFASDIERTDVLYTSLLIQMWQGLAATHPPAWAQSARAWRRSWLLGFATAVVARVRAAEQGAAKRASDAAAGDGPSAALVLADRTEVIDAALRAAYPVTRTSRVTYSGSGYGSGYAQGQRADIGMSRLGRTAGRALARS